MNLMNALLKIAIKEKATTDEINNLIKWARDEKFCDELNHREQTIVSTFLELYRTPFNRTRLRSVVSPTLVALPRAREEKVHRCLNPKIRQKKFYIFKNPLFDSIAKKELKKCPAETI